MIYEIFQLASTALVQEKTLISLNEAEFNIKAASSSKIAGKRALTKLTLNFRKSLRPPTFVHNRRVRIALVWFFI